MKPVARIIGLLLIAVSIAHLLRLIFQIELIVGSFHIPFWLSIFGFTVPAILAVMLRRDNTKEFIKVITPLKIPKKKSNQ